MLKLYRAPNFSTTQSKTAPFWALKLLLLFFLEKKKKKKKKNRDCPSHPLGQKWGWFDHQPKANFFFFFFFLKKKGFGFLGMAKPPPRAWGGFGHPLQPV
jgi:hypothetical protein